MRNFKFFSQIEWLPNEISNGCGGRELPCVSLLGPFLAITVFAEEDPTVAEKFCFEKQSQATARGLTQQLQKELELLRVSFKFIFLRFSVTNFLSFLSIIWPFFNKI